MPVRAQRAPLLVLVPLLAHLMLLLELAQTEETLETVLPTQLLVLEVLPALSLAAPVLAASVPSVDATRTLLLPVTVLPPPLDKVSVLLHPVNLVSVSRLEAATLLLVPLATLSATDVPMTQPLSSVAWTVKLIAEMLLQLSEFHSSFFLPVEPWLMVSPACMTPKSPRAQRTTVRSLSTSRASALEPDPWLAP